MEYPLIVRPIECDLLEEEEKQKIQRNRVCYLNIGTFSMSTIGRPAIYRISTNSMDGCCMYERMK